MAYVPLRVDDFAASKLATHYRGAGVASLVVSGGHLVPTAAGGATNLEFQHSGTYSRDGRGTFRWHLGATAPTMNSCGFYLKQVGDHASDTLLARYDAVVDQLMIRKRVGGAFTTLANPTLAGIDTNVDLWMQVEIVGNVVTLRAYDGNPLTGSPTLLQTAAATLAGADATAFGSGVAGNWGHRWSPQGTDEWIDDVTIEISDADGPYLYAGGDAGTGLAVSKALMKRVVNADKFLYLGDVYTPDGIYATDYDSVAGSTGFNDLRPITRATPGNWDWPVHASAGAFDAYWNPFHALDGIAASPPARYSFMYNGWKIICINSEENGGVGTGIGAAAEAYLDAQLAGGGNQRIVITHRPRYSPGPIPTEDRGDQVDMAAFWALCQGRALAVLSGHTHVSARMPAVGGTYQLLAGSGGDSFNTVPDLSAAGPATFKDVSDEAVLRLKLGSGGTLDGVWIKESDGSSMGAFSLATSVAPPPPSPAAWTRWESRAFASGGLELARSGDEPAEYSFPAGADGSVSLFPGFDLGTELAAGGGTIVTADPRIRAWIEQSGIGTLLP